MIRMELFFPETGRQSRMYFSSRDEMNRFLRTLHGVSRQYYTYEWEDVKPPIPKPIEGEIF